ncbi:MAG: hypothetical protein KDA96_18245, partial [Planctomycetaceae bacterium]|nr:hypothetical protein [Planctomycetaceae bacterium]
MAEFLTRLKRATSRLVGDSAAQFPTPFQIQCSCGQPVAGMRQPAAQILRCQHCQATLYALPINVYPRTHRVHSEVISSHLSDRLSAAVTELYEHPQPPPTTGFPLAGNALPPTISGPAADAVVEPASSPQLRMPAPSKSKSAGPAPSRPAPKKPDGQQRRRTQQRSSSDQPVSGESPSGKVAARPAEPDTPRPDRGRSSARRPPQANSRPAPTPPSARQPPKSERPSLQQPVAGKVVPQASPTPPAVAPPPLTGDVKPQQPVVPPPVRQIQNELPASGAFGDLDFLDVERQLELDRLTTMPTPVVVPVSSPPAADTVIPDDQLEFVDDEVVAAAEAEDEEDDLDDLDDSVDLNDDDFEDDDDIADDGDVIDDDLEFIDDVAPASSMESPRPIQQPSPGSVPEIGRPGRNPPSVTPAATVVAPAPPPIGAGRIAGDRNLAVSSAEQSGPVPQAGQSAPLRLSNRRRRRLLTPFRMTVAAMVVVIGLTGWWMAERRARDEARLAIRHAVDDVNQALKDEDLVELESSLSKAVEATRTLDQTDAESQYLQNMYQQTLAVNHLLEVDLAAELADGLRGGLGNATTTRLAAIRDKLAPGWIVFECRVLAIRENPGAAVLEMPMTIGSVPVEIRVFSTVLPEATRAVGDQPILFAARIHQILPPVIAGRPVVVQLDSGSCTLFTTPVHCRAVGLTVLDSGPAADLL